MESKTTKYECPGKIKTLTETAEESMPHFDYHNFNHAIDVYSAVNTLALLSQLGNEDRYLLRTAALLHDVIFIPGSKTSEERSAEFAEQYLPLLGYSVEQAKKVGKIILATKMPQNPRNYLEQLICDADLDNLGRPDFFELGEELRKEFGLSNGRDWYEQQLKFLKSHKYHTEVARKLRDAGKAANIQKLEEMLQELKC